MEASIFLAKIMGIVALLMGASMAVRRKMLLSIFHELAKSRATSYILGVLITIFGLLIVLNHGVFQAGFPLVITAVGWFVLAEGVSYLFVSAEFLDKYMSTLNNGRVYYLIAVVYLVLGGYLTYSGFFQR